MLLEELTPEILHVESARVQAIIETAVADELPLVALTGSGGAFIDQIRIILADLDGDDLREARASLLEWLDEFRNALSEDQSTEPEP
jgi:hypothetical protein